MLVLEVAELLLDIFLENMAAMELGYIECTMHRRRDAKVKAKDWPGRMLARTSGASRTRTNKYAAT